MLSWVFGMSFNVVRPIWFARSGKREARMSIDIIQHARCLGGLLWVNYERGPCGNWWRNQIRLKDFLEIFVINLNHGLIFRCLYINKFFLNNNIRVYKHQNFRNINYFANDLIIRKSQNWTNYKLWKHSWQSHIEMTYICIHHQAISPLLLVSVALRDP